MTWDELLESDPDDMSDAEIDGASDIAFRAYSEAHITMGELWGYMRVFDRLKARRVRERAEAQRLDEMFYDYVADWCSYPFSAMAH